MLSVSYAVNDAYTLANKGLTTVTVTGNVTSTQIYANTQVKPYTAQWSSYTGVTINVKRTSSPNVGASTGILSSGATVYYGDVLSVTYSANTGYTLSSKGSTSITVTGNITSSHIYASATAHKYTVTYNANGGSGTTSQTTHTYGVSSALRSNGFSRSNYTFLGWSTSSSATTPTYTNGQVVTNLTFANGGNITLYAVWVKTYGSYTYSGRGELDLEDVGNLYKETYNVALNKTNLKANGYTKIKITVKFEAWEGWLFHNTKPIVYVYQGTSIYTSYKHSELSGGYTTFTHTFTVPVDVLDSNGKITIGYTGEEYPNTEGTQNGWRLRDATVTATAIK